MTTSRQVIPEVSDSKSLAKVIYENGLAQRTDEAAAQETMDLNVRATYSVADLIQRLRRVSQLESEVQRLQWTLMTTQMRNRELKRENRKLRCLEVEKEEDELTLRL